MEEIIKKTSAGISIFIDMLGFGRKVLDASSFEDIKTLVNSLDVVRDAFDYNLKTNDSTTEEKRYALSDSIITFIPLQSKAMDYSNSFDVLLYEISSLAYNQMICIQNGIFVRGGISLGWFYEDGNNYISDALTQAVTIEKEIWAPVIGISDHTIEYFLEHKGRNCYAKESDPMENGTFEKIEINGKEFYFINYLKIAIDAVEPLKTEEFRLLLRSEDQDKINQAYWHAQIDALIYHKEKIIEAANLIDEKCVLEKYQWLADYHNRYSESYAKIDSSVMITNVIINKLG